MSKIALDIVIRGYYNKKMNNTGNYKKKTKDIYFKNIGGDDLEFVMNKIMSIDKDAESYRKGIDELLKEKQDELEKTIMELQITFQEEAKNIKTTISNEKIIDAENRAKIIIKEKEEGLNDINAKYQKNKLQIVDEVLNGIIQSL